MAKFQHVKTANRQHRSIRTEVECCYRIIVRCARVKIRSLSVPYFVARILAGRCDVLGVG